MVIWEIQRSKVVKYKCLKSTRYTFHHYDFVTLRRKDMQLIKQWRNDQIDVLRQNKMLTSKDQRNHYEKVIVPAIMSNKPHCILFSILKKGKCIGYGGLTNIDWTYKRAEISFIVNTLRARDAKTYVQDFKTFLKAIINISFMELGLNRLFTETYDIRPLHVSILERTGFKLEGKLKQHVFIKNSFVDSLFHGILRKDYLSR